MGTTAIIVIVSVVALIFAVFAIMMVFAALGKRHHHEKSDRSRKH